MWSLIVPLWKILGFKDDTELQTIQRKHSEAVKWACNHNLPSCVHLATTLYAQWMATPKHIKYVGKKEIVSSFKLLVEFLSHSSRSKYSFNSSFLFAIIINSVTFQVFLTSHVPPPRVLEWCLRSCGGLYTAPPSLTEEGQSGSLHGSSFTSLMTATTKTSSCVPSAAAATPGRRQGEHQITTATPSACSQKLHGQKYSYDCNSLSLDSFPFPY